MVGFGKEDLCNFRSHGGKIGHLGIKYICDTKGTKAFSQVKIRDYIKFGNGHIHDQVLAVLPVSIAVQELHRLLIVQEIIHSHALVRQEEPHLTAALQAQRNGTELIRPVIGVAAALVHEVALHGFSVSAEQVEQALQMAQDFSNGVSNLMNYSYLMAGKKDVSDDA